MHRVALGLTIICLLLACSNKLIPGEYHTNFPTYGMFGKTLTLDCDSSAIMNFQGDLMNDNSYGQWKTIEDTLVITFDTLNYPTSRYKNNLSLLIKGKKLLNVPFSKEKYMELELIASDSIDIPSLKSLNRKADKNMKYHYGKMKRQYFIRIESSDCE